MIDTSRFRDWLEQECERAGGQRELSRRADLVNTTIGTLLRTNRAPDSATILKLSQATGMHPYNIWSLLAGIPAKRLGRGRRIRR